ncbi:outer membrane porin GjpA [[Mycobacterium] crassicus]|uniref:Outer membrane porin GjpA n=1 Tax=[Mycobacterium] crassicus TaxID=2872309 RepID=A0ABU5XD90_9MYCO|nr:outer membrane porin GjpA [Mycolicibacter sp. MYC098]MEB3019758.1 outer membrane porin GjpA [Mycolicibacter sp. MYC098]
MRQSLRPHVTAGIAVLGAGMVAVAPVAAASAVEVQPMPEVALTAGVELGDIDFSQAWTDAFDTAKDNFTAVQAAASDASSALSDALKAADFSALDFNQLTAALTFLAGDQKSFLNVLAPQTLDDLHAVMYMVLTDPAGTLTGGEPALPEDLLPLVNFAASPLSGQLFAALGPSISPMVALINSIEAIGTNLGGADGATPDLTAALQEMVNIPANMVNGMLNGATLNLDALAPALADTGLLPEGMGVDGISLAFGGLLSPGSVNGVTDGGDGESLIGSVGGSILNALGLNLTGVPVLGTLDLEANGIGPLGAFAMMQNIVAQWLSGELPPLEPVGVDPGAGVADVDLLSGFDFGDLFGLGV